ncbi:unnamed protein product [Effrenium voratum]|uniref:Amino acid transporter transmembrane domain-containing protein n=1 Tax=Effrenium voratum TaxID=2562239 RepID=A0AA36IBH0_9DINO|nr:unnamed protein product [Effrenium voratum]CAJ1425847.1 unnamed protein product [Effrenium voratum]
MDVSTECLATEQCPARAEKKLSETAAVTTLTQNVLGSGVLALPYAISSAGVVGGLGMLLFVYLLSVFTMAILVALSNTLGTFSYHGAASRTAGPRTAMWAEIWVLCCNLGLCISYVILLGDFAFALAEQFGFHHASKSGCMATLVVCICWPLSCAPSLGFLRWMSLVGLASILFAAVAAGLRFFDGSYFDAAGPPKLSAFESASFGNCFPILVGAFGAHTNIPLLYKELAPGAATPNWGRTQEGQADFWKMMRVICYSLSISSVIYGWVGIVVYATFGPKTKSDFSENFRADDQLLVVLRLTMTCAICSSFALMMMSARAAAFNLFLLPLGCAVKPVSRVMVATSLSAICLGVATVAKEIGTVLAYNGSVFATPVCFVAPPLMYLCLPRQSRQACWSILCILSAFAGTAFGLYGVVLTLGSHT